MPTEYDYGAANGFPGQVTAVRVTIKNGSDGVSDPFPTQGRAIMGLVMPATWVAAAVVFKGGMSSNPAAMLPMYDSGANPEGTPSTAVQGTIITFPGDALFVPFLQLVSATAGTFMPVDQTADREIIVIFKQYLT